MTCTERHIRNALSLFVITIIMILACLNPSLAEPVSELKKTISLVAAIHCDYSPVSFWNKTTNTPSGFFVDIMDRVALRAGIQVSYICRDSWDETITAIESGKADIGVLMRSKEREKKLLFSTPIYTTYLVFFARSENDVDPEKVPSDNIVGVIKGSMSYEKLKYLEGGRLQIYGGYREALIGLLTGEISLFAGEESMVQKQIRETGLEDRIKKVGKPFVEVQRCLVVRKGNVQLLELMNKTMKDFVRGPEYQKIYLKWYGAPTPYWTNRRVLMASSIFLIIAISGMAFWRYMSISKINRELIRTMSERNQAEEMLRVSEERLRQSAYVANLGIFDHDHLSETIYWSSRQREIYGWRPDETVTLKAFIGCIYPEDLERITAEVRRAHDPEGNGVFRVEHRIIRRDGSIRWVTTRSQTFFSGEGSARRPVRTIGAVSDITERKRMETERSNLIIELQEALSKVKQLSGLLPICASCKKIRDDRGYWQRIETYISEHSEALFTHGICPVCAKKMYPEYYDTMGERREVT
ncbi:MAG TPA: transporter substrate-binding domain-containing protein [Dissulfurispiraceae bacterium]|nr:transporter substrate-binding domain-containing protein [Dissulfurispiraceae bacterium]